MKKILIATCLFFAAYSANADWVYDEKLTEAESLESTQTANAELESTVTANVEAEVAAAPEDTNIYAISVPSSGFIQNAIMLASIKSGSGSTAIDSIVDVLKSDTPRNLMVFGESQPIVVATIDASIKALKGQPSKSTLLYHGEKKYCDEILALTKDSGVKVVTTVK